LNPDQSSSSPKDTRNIDIKSSTDFVTPSLFLFVDNILVSLGGWIFWLVIPKLVTASEVGLAVTVYSLVMLITTITQLGLEYPLLKKSSISGSKILGTTFLIESLVTLASIPFIFIFINIVYEEPVAQFTWISIGLLVILSLEFVFRFALLGISNSKIVMIIDFIGVIIKLSTGFLLVSLSFGTMGILLAYLFEGFFVLFASLYFVHKSLEFGFGNIGFIRETIEDALINTPAKWSKMVIVILGVVLLSLFSISASDVGIFYVSLMITLVVASFASSMAYMVIPSSNVYKKDLSSGGLRLSLGLTTPIVVLLLVASGPVLSLIGKEYESAESILIVLTLAIIPMSITVNLISKLNNLNKSKTLIITGFIQLATFFICFFITVPLYGTMGAAISILVTYIVSSIFLVIISDRNSLRWISSACFSIFAGFATNYVLGAIMGYQNELVVTAFSVTVSILAIFLSKCMTKEETSLLLKEIIRRS
jgi:O-antigen/teichoic acid export membrane protein